MSETSLVLPIFQQEPFSVVCTHLVAIYKVGWYLYCVIFIFSQDEQFSHQQTKSKLEKVSEKLNFALGEIEILNKQLKKEKEVFHNSYVFRIMLSLYQIY